MNKMILSFLMTSLYIGQIDAAAHLICPGAPARGAASVRLAESKLQESTNQIGILTQMSNSMLSSVLPFSDVSQVSSEDLEHVNREIEYYTGIQNQDYRRLISHRRRYDDNLENKKEAERKDYILRRKKLDQQAADVLSAQRILVARALGVGR